VATSLHLQTLIQTVTKDQHLLTMGDTQSEDKMNFSAVEKITALSVSQLLNDHVEDRKGTVIYLKMLRSVLQAFLNKTLQPRRRVYLMWYSVFFLRIWRNWLKESHTFSVTKNFITLNASLCIELNGHALIKMLRKYRKGDESSDTQFTTWLFSSQPCEQIFRATR
jgi:hypothetical protein